MVNEYLMNKYSSGDDLVQKLSSCKYCVFEDILSEEDRKAKNLLKDIPKGNHPHRETIEEACAQNIDEHCDMKHIAMRSSLDDFMLSQMGALQIFRFDMAKAYEKPIGSNDAYIIWSENRDDISNDEGSPTNYAARWREVWELSKDIAGRQTLTEEGMYRITIASDKVYKTWKSNAEELKEEEEERHYHGSNSLEAITDKSNLQKTLKIMDSNLSNDLKY